MFGFFDLIFKPHPKYGFLKKIQPKFNLGVIKTTTPYPLKVHPNKKFYGTNRQILV